MMKPPILLSVLLLALMVSGQAQGIQMVVTPSAESITLVTTDSFSISLSATGGFNQQIGLTATSDLTVGTATNEINITFSVANVFYPYTGGSTMFVSPGSAIPLGQHWIAITAANGPVSTHDTVHINIVADSCNWTSYGTAENFYRPGGFSRVISIAVGNNGVVWAGGSGIYQYLNSTWTQYNSSNSSLPNDIVNDLKTDSAGNIWIATLGGLAKFDGTFWSVYDSANSGLTTSLITSVDIDTQNNIWVATSIMPPYSAANNSKGVFKFNGTVWTNYNNANSGLPSNNISRIRCDKYGNVYALTTYSPWNIFKLNGSSWIPVTGGIAAISGCVQDFSIDTLGNLWIASRCGNGALIKYEGNKIERWISRDSTPFNHFVGNLNGSIISEDSGSGLIAAEMFNVYVDSRNIVWMAGTNGYDLGSGNGLGVFDGSGWAYYTTSNSTLPYQAVFGMREKKGVLWITTGEGDFTDDSPYKTVASLTCPDLTHNLTYITTDTFFLNTDTGTNTTIETLPQKNYPGLELSPNPIAKTGMLRLTLSGFSSEVEITVYNMLGQLIGKTTAAKTNSYLNISPLESGVYLISVTDGTDRLERKLVVQ